VIENSNKLGSALCNAIGLNPKLVKSISIKINCEVDDIATLDVVACCFADERTVKLVEHMSSMINPLCPHCRASTYKHTAKDDRSRYLCRIRKTKGCGKVITTGPSKVIGRPKRTDGLTAAEVVQKQRDQ